MFLITSSVLWSVTFFFSIFYIFICFLMICYIIFSIKIYNISSSSIKTSTFDYLSPFDSFWLFFTFIIIFYCICSSWSSHFILIWFGNLLFSSFQYKFFYFILLFFYFIILFYASIIYSTNKEFIDFIITNFSFFIWFFFFFCSNNLFVTIFFIEIFSTLIFMLLISSNFSTIIFFNNLNLNNFLYFQQSMPTYYITSLVYFFWISLVASLNLFLSLILFYIKFFQFDWYMIEYIFQFFILISSFKDIFFITIVWFYFLFSVFLKCGLVPFFFWKPIFFKGVSILFLFFYIIIYYFFILLFFFYFFLIYINEVFFYFLFLNVFTLLIGFIILLSILCEAYYIKSFLAMSSILNTLFLFLALNSFFINDNVLLLI